MGVPQAPAPSRSLQQPHLTQQCRLVSLFRFLWEQLTFTFPMPRMGDFVGRPVTVRERIINSQYFSQNYIIVLNIFLF